jgi:hypothetical protein
VAWYLFKHRDKFTRTMKVYKRRRNKSPEIKDGRKRGKWDIKEEERKNGMKKAK